MALEAASVEALAVERAALRELAPGEELGAKRLVEMEEPPEAEVLVEAEAEAEAPEEEVSEPEAAEEALEVVLAAALLEEPLEESEVREPPALVSLERTVLFMSTPEEYWERVKSLRRPRSCGAFKEE
jgi:hypothetical protein